MKSLPRILCVVQLPPPVHGVSMMNQIIKDSSYLNKQLNLEYFNLQYSKDFKEFVSGINVKKMLRMILYYLKFIKQLILHKPNLVYFTITPSGIGFIRDSFFVLCSRLFNIPVILHLHGKGIEKSYKKRKNLYDAVFKKSYVISLSNELVKDISFINCKKNLVVHNGINIPVNRSRIPSVNGCLRILYFSLVSRLKGVYDIIDVVSELSKEGYNIKLDIVGPLGNSLTEESFIAYLNNKETNQNIKWHGPIYGEDKYEFFRNNDILILPSYNDAFPLVLLEALGMGLPCISTFVGGIPDIITDSYNGFLYKSGDLKMLRLHLLKFYDTNLLNNMRDNCVESYKRNYTIQKFEESFFYAIHDIEETEHLL